MGLLSAAAGAKAEDPPGMLECYEAEVADPSVRQLSWLGRNLVPWINMVVKIPSFVDQEGSPQSNLVRNRPDLWLPGIQATCEAWTFSWALCGSKFTYNVEDSEVDSVRHFLFAARLANRIGEKDALEVLAVHEGDPKAWNDGNRMDAFNNLVALRWVRDQGKSGKIPTEKILQAALGFVRDKSLRALRPVNRQSCPFEDNAAKSFAALESNAAAIRYQLPGSMAPMCRFGI